jgi:hypothetical protein
MLIGKTITVALCLILATCQMPLRSASAQRAGETRWEADCRRGYIRKAFPKNYPGLEFSDAVRIDILPEEFADLEKAIREMRKCEKFYQCLADRDQGKVKHCYENDRRWR